MTTPEDLELEPAMPRSALLIGIDNYPFFPPANQLRGCRNDVALFEKFLREAWAFPEDAIRRLVDQEAAGDRIREELDALVERVDAGSRVVLYFSGHGSRWADEDGEGREASVAEGRLGDEDDGWDETLVPHDSGRDPHPNHDLGDDEIHVCLAKLLEKDATVLLVVDACRSGTVFRDEIDGVRIRQLPPARGRRRSGVAAAPRAALWSHDRFLSICACEDHQVACEMELAGAVHGAFTYHLVRALGHLPPEATWSELRERILLRLQSAFSNQWPRFSGNLGDRVPARHAPATHEEPVDAPDERLGIRCLLEGEAAARVRLAAADSPWLRVTEDGAPAWARLEPLAAPRSDLRLPADGRRRWSLTRAGGEVVWVDEEGDAEVLVKELGRWARYSYLLRLDAVGPSRPPIDIELLHQDHHGRWVAPPESPAGDATYRDGDRLGLRLVHRGETALHCAVVLLGGGGGVQLLYPLEVVEPLVPGRIVSIGLGFSRRIHLRLFRPAWRIVPPQGDLEQIKVFVSPSPCDWVGWLLDLYGGPVPPPASGAWSSWSKTLRLMDK